MFKNMHRNTLEIMLFFVFGERVQSTVCLHDEYVDIRNLWTINNLGGGLNFINMRMTPQV